MSPGSTVFSYVAILTLLFGLPLGRLALYSAGSDLHSHILLVPFVSAYILHERRRSLPPPGRRALWPALPFVLGGLAAAAIGLFWGTSLSTGDYLASMALSYVSLLAAGGFLLRGRAWMRAAGFPFAFLVFLVPLPDSAVHWLEQGSMYASAEAAALYFWLAGTPLVRDGTLFELPGITLQVAQECSGIRSSWVLFVTSIIASNMFLKSGWRRLALVAFVIPLGILRNGLRVFVLGILSVRFGPNILDTAIHHRGGILFFALSLVPLFGLLWCLRRGERVDVYGRSRSAA